MSRNSRTIRTLGIVALAALVLLAPAYLNSPYWVSVLVLAAINCLLTVSLRTISLLDQISLGHVGFALIGAYTSALLVMRAGLSFWVALLIAGLLAGVVALALSYPFLRVKGIYFAMLTLLTAETFRQITWSWRAFTGGQNGIAGIPAPSPLGPIGFDDVNNYYYLALGVVVVSLLLLYRLERSPLGFRWRAIRDADSLAQSVGIDDMRYKIVNFAIASFFAGISGALVAHHTHVLSPDIGSRFGVLMSLNLVIYLVVGGSSRFAGPIIGAVALTIVGELARPLKEFQPMLMGGIAIAVALLLPGGLVGLPDRIRLWRSGPAQLEMGSTGVRRPVQTVSEATAQEPLQAEEARK